MDTFTLWPKAPDFGLIDAKEASGVMVIGTELLLEKPSVESEMEIENVFGAVTEIEAGKRKLTLLLVAVRRWY